MSGLTVKNNNYDYQRMKITQGAAGKEVWRGQHFINQKVCSYDRGNSYKE